MPTTQEILTAADQAKIIRTGPLRFTLSTPLGEVSIPRATFLEGNHGPLLIAVRNALRQKFPQQSEADSSAGSVSAISADSLPDVPTQTELENEVLGIVQEQHAKFLEAVQAGDWSAVTKILKALEDLRKTSRIAAAALGMLTPFRPQINDMACCGGEPIDLAATVSPAAPSHMRPAGGWDFPWLDEAVKFLRTKRIIDATGLQAIAKQDRPGVFAAPPFDDMGTLNRLKQSLGTSLREGLDQEGAREAAETMLRTTLDKVGLSDADFNTIFRTNTHQAYQAGLDGALRNPTVRETFTCVQGIGTRDTRTRASHAWWGGAWRNWQGVVVRVGSPAYEAMMRAYDQYGCRCSMNPMTQEDAEAIGITEIEDVPLWVITAGETGKEPADRSLALAV